MATWQDFYVAPTATQGLAQGLGTLGKAYFQKQAQQEQEQKLFDQRMGFMNAMKGAFAIQDPQERETALLDIQLQYPEQLTQFYQATQEQQKASGQPLTIAETEKFRIEDEKLRLRELELKAQKAGTDLERKRLENQITLQGQKIRENERKAIAAERGDDAQKMLANAKEGEKKAASFADRMIQSDLDLNRLEQVIDPTDRFIPIIAGGKGLISEFANRQASPDEQQYATAASDFVTAQLRKESGAVIGDEEFERKYREFFPVPGDTPAQIESKRNRRARASKNMEAESGGLYNALYGEQAQSMTQTEQSAAQYTEGQTATNPQTGERLVFRGGQWQTL